jgi:hypothetical protein
MFSIANCNKGNPNVNKDFSASILMDVMPDTKWACCIVLKTLCKGGGRGVWRGVGRFFKKMVFSSILQELAHKYVLTNMKIMGPWIK